MIKKLFAIQFAASLFCTTAVLAQYDTKLIAPSLLQNANVIVRLEEKNIIIKNESTAIIKHKYV